MIATDNEPINKKLKIKNSFMYNNPPHRGIYISMCVCVHVYMYTHSSCDRSRNYCGVCVFVVVVLVA
jgi:hypothetical protein